MSLHPQPPSPSIPAETARVARAAFPKGNPYLTLRDDLGPVFADGDFDDLYPKRGQPAYPPWRLALVTLLQFREGLSDRQAADAVRARIDWKYLLGLELGDAGFDFSVLCEFRSRLLAGSADERLLERVLEACRARGLLKARGQQRTDSTHVLAAVRELNRLELLGETLRAALNAVATANPDWLRALAPPVWYERYSRRIEDLRLPKTPAAREAYAGQVGDDGFQLLAALDDPEAPPTLAALPAVEALVWRRHFERETTPDSPEEPGRARLQAVRGRGGEDRLESPYDPEARYRSKSGMGWTGYMVHLTETCDEDAPRLVVHADTTAANVHEAMRTEPIHAALAAKGLDPATHLVDAAYVSAAHLLAAHETFNIDLVGPTRADQSWQHREGNAFRAADFHIDWDANPVRAARRARAGAPMRIRRVGRSSRSGSIQWTAGPVRRGRSVPKRPGPNGGASSSCIRVISTRRWSRHGRGRRPPATGRSTRCARALRARCPRRCAASACGAPGTAGSPRPIFSTSPPPPPSTLIGSPPGCRGGPSPRRGSHASRL
jgi:transposase